MSKFLFAALMALGLASWPISANADWQFTKWGMTPDQVQAASGNKLGAPVGYEICAPQCNPVPRLAGAYSSEDFTFRARFDFDAAIGLQKVALSMQEGAKCRALYDSLVAKYGLPVSTVPGQNLSSAKWLDTAGGNTVQFKNAVALDNSCAINYTPLASGKGL